MSKNSPYQVKDPQGVLDYYVDWSEWLKTGDSIDISTWDVATGLSGGSTIADGNKRGIWLSGGTVGITYRVTNTITTTQGRVEQQSLWIGIRDK